MNFYDVLAAEKWGGGIPTTNFFDLLFAQYMSGGGQWETYDGTLPATINANGSDLRQYQVWGNAGGVGEPTENMFDESKAGMIRFSNVVELRYGINFGILPAGAYTISFNHVGSQSLILTTHYNDTYSNENIINKSPYTFTTQENTEIIIRTQSDRPTTFSNMGFTNIILTEGSTPPVSFVPFGYEVDMASRTRNLLPFNDKNFIINSNHSNLIVKCENGNLYMKGTATEIISTNMGWKNNLTFELEAGEYFCNTPSPLGTGFGRYIKKYDNDSNLIASANNTFTLTERTKCYLAFYIYNKTIDNKIELMLNLGSTALPYEPYSNTVTPIYIGDEPLDKDEYVDYAEQKVYRMINGTLTPTDPPVALPALPTCKGETVIDYAGESVAPEKVYFEYQGGKQP